MSPGCSFTFTQDLCQPVVSVQNLSVILRWNILQIPYPFEWIKKWGWSTFLAHPPHLGLIWLGCHRTNTWQVISYGGDSIQPVISRKRKKKGMAVYLRVRICHFSHVVDIDFQLLWFWCRLLQLSLYITRGSVYWWYVYRVDSLTLGYTYFGATALDL